MRPTPDGSRSPWFAPRQRHPEARITLFCLPFSGAGASIYRSWQRIFPAEIEVCPIHLPGREERLEESADLNPAEIAGVIAERLDLPYAVYGHSMEARLGLEVIRSLLTLGTAPPLRFYPAACSPPHIVDTVAAECVDLPDEPFLDMLVSRLGAATELRDLPELRQLLLPLLRSDLEWCRSFSFHPGALPGTAIMAIAGQADGEATAKKMAEWSQYTDRFTLRTVPGGHFFLQAKPGPLAAMLAADLISALPAPACPARAHRP